VAFFKRVERNAPEMSIVTEDVHDRVAEAAIDEDNDIVLTVEMSYFNPDELRELGEHLVEYANAVAQYMKEEEEDATD
jgi:hypothetical protein